MIKLIRYFFKKEFWVFLGNYWLGTTEMVSQDYKKAITHLTRCLENKERFDKTGLVYEHLGKCYFGIDEIEKSKFYLLKALEMRLDKDLNSEIASRLGFIFYQEKDYQKAKYYLEYAKVNYKNGDYTNLEAVKEYLKKMDVMRDSEEDSEEKGPE
jgi:tetratricopeptide (TPR) repeat protein